MAKTAVTNEDKQDTAPHPGIARERMKRSSHLPWLVALGVLALAALPVLAALATHRAQARRAEALLFERSAEVVTAQLQLLTSRQMSWQSVLRMRLSNRTEVAEEQLDELFTYRPRLSLPENCRAVGYGALEGGRVSLRWQRGQKGAVIGALGDDLLSMPTTAALLRAAIDRPARTASVQSGTTLVTAMTVAETSPRDPRGWIVASWDLGAMCADPQIRLVADSHTLSSRPLDGAPEPDERVAKIGENEAVWRVVVGRGAGFGALFPAVSEHAIALTGGGCALLLALLAGFATRAVGLHAALAAERELVEMKDHLLHSVSHEFRTPLSVILSSTELLETYDARLSPERRAEALTQIRDSTARMNDLVGQVLFLSRIEARRMPVERKPLDVAAFARALARETETTAHARCSIRVAAPEKLDATLDPALLRAVLGNLLSNAAKFSPEGTEVRLTIEPGDHLRFVIRDNGPGIAGDDLPRVREAFFRSASTAETPGSGLGLAIADKCAALLGGTLVIESAPSGTTATLTL